MFRVLSDIHLGSGSVRIISITRNTIKQDPFGIYAGFGSVRIHFYRIGFGSGFRVRFIWPALAVISKNSALFFHLDYCKLYNPISIIMYTDKKVKKSLEFRKGNNMKQNEKWAGKTSNGSIK